MPNSGASFLDLLRSSMNGNQSALANEPRGQILARRQVTSPSPTSQNRRCAKMRHRAVITEIGTGTGVEEKRGRVSSERQHSTPAGHAGSSAATPGDAELYMVSLLLGVIVAIVFVLWLALITVSTGTFRIERHAHHHHMYLDGRR